MGIHLVTFDGELNQQILFPQPLDPQRVKISDKQTCLQLGQKTGEYFARWTEQQVTGNVFLLKFSESFQQSAQHKPVLTQRGLQKIRD